MESNTNAGKILCPRGCTGPDEGGSGCAAVYGECAMPDAARAAPGVPAAQPLAERALLEQCSLILADAGWRCSPPIAGLRNLQEKLSIALAAPAGISQQAGGAVPVDRDSEVLAMLARVLKYIDPRAVDADLARNGPMEDAYINTIARKCVERHLAILEAAPNPALAVPVQADRMPKTAAKPCDGSDPMPKRTAFLAWCKSRALDTDTEKDAWGALQFKHSHIQAMWEGWFNAPVAPLPLPEGPSDEHSQNLALVIARLEQIVATEGEFADNLVDLAKDALPCARALATTPVAPP